MTYDTTIADHATYDRAVDHFARQRIALPTFAELAEPARISATRRASLAGVDADVDDAVRRGWDGPLERLIGLGALPPGSILAHGVHLSEAQVRRTDALGCWLVQNPRSNRGNRVGYPVALHASKRVALGTDGYPSDLEAERAALLEDASRHGDDCEAVVRRPQAGHALFAERFGGAAPAPRATPDINLDAIRAEAAAEAPRLWSRMAEP